MGPRLILAYDRESRATPCPARLATRAGPEGPLDTAQGNGLQPACEFRQGLQTYRQERTSIGCLGERREHACGSPRGSVCN
jgi:hypothetical protein